MIVLDASAALAFTAPTQATNAARTFAETVARPLIAPAIFPFEFRNSLLRLERRRTLRSVDVDSHIALVSGLVDQVRPPPEDSDLARIVALARRLHLNFFDATYLDLAAVEGAGLASRDAAQLAAARAVSVEVFDLR